MDNDLSAVKKNDAVVVALLAVVSLIAIVANVYFLWQGHFVRPVSYNDVVIAIGGFAMLRFAVFGRGIRIGVALWAFGATIRAFTHYLHTSREVERLGAIDGQLLKLVGFIVVIVAAVQWFREVRIQPTASVENSLGLR